MRQINALVSLMDGRYFVNVYGDEILLKADNNVDATSEALEILRQAEDYVDRHGAQSFWTAPWSGDLR